MTRRTITVLVAVLLVLALAAGGATAATEIWSNERLTVEVKRLKRQNANLRYQIEDMQANHQSLLDWYDTHLPRLLSCIKAPEAEEAACSETFGVNVP